jgi:hypothetical protein
MTNEHKSREAGIKAVIYGLPLLIMDLTKINATNVLSPRGVAAPLNQFGHMREFPTAAFKQVVRANVDTLYSSAFLDLTEEPLVLSVPDTNGRYYLLPLFDAWGNVFASPGTRTTGNDAAHFVIVGPNWQGRLPANLQALKSSTNMAWILGRTQTNGPSDYAAVHAVQDGYKLTPLSRFGTAYVPPAGNVDPDIDMKVPPVDKLKAMNAESYFSALAHLLKSNPPPLSDEPMMEVLASIGIIPGQPFSMSTLDPAVARGIEGSVAQAVNGLLQASKETGHSANGWRIPGALLGNYGANYNARAVISLIAFGANLPADAVYPTTFVDADGTTLNGANRYTLHFEKGSTPPVRAFWSVTAYDDQSFFADNVINRYAISSWMPLKHNTDGSIDIHLAHQAPAADMETNWLPVPEGDFNLTMRMYWPNDQSPSIIDGSWLPPAVMRATY